MVSDENILLQYGAYYEHYLAKEIIFKNGDTPHFYLQISSGTVELNNYHEDGREFTLNIFSKGQSIGESLLFGNQLYPMNAIAKTDCSVLKLPKNSFMDLIRKEQDVAFKLFEYMSDRLFYKYVMLFNNSSLDPEAKIKALINYYKQCAMKEELFSYHLPFTRQQIANLTGLRVETVIRTIKRMADQGILHVENRQIYC